MKRPLSVVGLTPGGWSRSCVAGRTQAEPRALSQELNCWSGGRGGLLRSREGVLAAKNSHTFGTAAEGGRAVSADGGGARESTPQQCCPGAWRAPLLWRWAFGVLWGKWTPRSLHFCSSVGLRLD